MCLQIPCESRVLICVCSSILNVYCLWTLSSMIQSIIMLLFIILSIPCLYATPTLRNGFYFGAGGCTFVPEQNVETCHICFKRPIARSRSCFWVQIPSPPTQTVAPPGSGACTNTAVQPLECDIEQDGSLNSCTDYGSDYITFFSPPCSVNGRWPDNCRRQPDGRVRCG